MPGPLSFRNIGAIYAPMPMVVPFESLTSTHIVPSVRPSRTRGLKSTHSLRAASINLNYLPAVLRLGVAFGGNAYPAAIQQSELPLAETLIHPVLRLLSRRPLPRFLPRLGSSSLRT